MTFTIPTNETVAIVVLGKPLWELLFFGFGYGMTPCC
jgi:hypothetical protein